MTSGKTGHRNERAARVKTKIVATVGPASDEYPMLRDLVLAGVDVFRLNFAHGRHDWLAGIVADIRRVSADLGRPIGILGDLSGPKIRLEELPGGQITCNLGDEFEFAREADPLRPNRLTCTYDRLVDELNVGDRVLLADGTVGMSVVGKPPGEGPVLCVVDQPGDIRSKQGINLPGVALSTPSLTDKDRDDLAWAVAQELDFVGLSFVRRADDIRGLQDAMAGLNALRVPHIVAKIEKMEAVDELEQILELTDAVMVARGDLGVEVDIAKVPGLQKRIVRLCNESRIPVITATQMLDSMERNSRPTRAEASDVANAVLDGSDAVMLSGETAIGQYPLEAVAMMSRLAREAELLQRLAPPTTGAGRQRSRALAVTEAVAQGAVKTAEVLGAELIVVASKTGRTALAVSTRRSPIPILGLSDAPAAARRMSLLWGVTPLETDLCDAPLPTLVEHIADWGRRKEVLQTGSKFILVTGSQWSSEGHDQLLVHTVT